MKRRKTIKFTALIAISTLIAGCGSSSFSTRQTNPLLTDYQGIMTPWTQSISTLSPDASRRITIMRLSDADENYVDGKWRAGEYCAEPPPDAMVNAASLFAIAAAAKIIEPKTGLEGSGQGQLEQQIASSQSPLFLRSQGLQWARDNLSFLCNAHLNRAITRAEYLKRIDTVIEQSQKIIENEIEHLPVLEYKFSGDTKGAPAVVPPPPIPALP